MSLTGKIKEVAELRRALAQHEADAKNTSDDYKKKIAVVQREIEFDGAMIDAAKVDLGYSVLHIRGLYRNGGSERKSVIDDAIHQIATGEKRGYLGLDREFFGTKNYDRWSGQRCDCEPGMGPRHGCIVFQVGLKDAIRQRGGVAALTDEEREAAVYVLTHLEAIQSAEARAA